MAICMPPVKAARDLNLFEPNRRGDRRRDASGDEAQSSHHLRVRHYERPDASDLGTRRVTSHVGDELHAGGGGTAHVAFKVRIDREHDILIAVADGAHGIHRRRDDLDSGLLVQPGDERRCVLDGVPATLGRHREHDAEQEGRHNGREHQRQERAPISDTVDELFADHHDRGTPHCHRHVSGPGAWSG
jgi:hypothetical protein